MRNWLAIGIGLFTLAAISFSSLSLAQAPAAKKNDVMEIKVNPASKARIDIPEMNWNFGSIPKGSIVSHSYQIKNIGEDTLQITNVKPTCGCTMAPLSSNFIAPGEEADLTANFNSEKFNGRVNKQINIDSTDPIKPYLKVIFTAIINNPLLTVTPDPAEIDFGTVKQGNPGQMKFTVTNGENKSVKLAVVDQGKAFKAKAPIDPIPPHGKADVTLELAPQSNQGTLQGSVTLEVVDLPNSRFTIPCKANIAM